MRRGGSRTLRMIGGAICPPGFFCMDTGFIVFTALVLLAVAGFAYMHAEKSEKEIKVLKYVMKSFPIMYQMEQMLPMFYPEMAKDLGIKMSSESKPKI